MATYLDFEEPLRELEDKILQTKELGENTDVDMTDKISELEKKLAEKTKKTFADLTPWQRVQLSRHPDRPYTLAYIEAMTDGQFQELHGDRNVKDDKAMVGGFGLLDGETVMFIGQQKGVNTKMRQFRNFGMPNPEGYPSRPRYTASSSWHQNRSHEPCRHPYPQHTRAPQDPSPSPQAS